MKQDNYNNRETQVCDGCFGASIAYGLILILVLLFSSCATKTRIEYRDRDVNHYINKEVHDTLVERITDSVYLETKQRGDTIYITKYKEKTRWKEKIVERHDTCWRDSIVKDYKEVTKKVTKYPKTYWWFMGISIISVIFAIYKIKKIWL